MQFMRKKLYVASAANWSTIDHDSISYVYSSARYGMHGPIIQLAKRASANTELLQICIDKQRNRTCQKNVSDNKEL